VIVDNFHLFFMSTLLRINEIAIQLGLTIGAIEKTIGASKGVLSKSLRHNTDIQSKWISKIVDNYPQFNANWLLTGTGSMFLENQPLSVNETSAIYIKNSSYKNNIPLVPTNALKKLNTTNFSLSKKDIIAYYNIPKFYNKKIDFMIEISGDTMIPRLKSGDIIACAIIKNSKFIQWNKPHVIVTKEQGILIKRLKQSKIKDCLLAISDNPQYDPFDLPIEEITGIALVVGGVFEE